MWQDYYCLRATKYLNVTAEFLVMKGSYTYVLTMVVTKGKVVCTNLSQTKSPHGG